MPGVMHRNGDMQYVWPATNMNGHDFGRRDSRGMVRDGRPPHDDLYSRVNKSNGAPPGLPPHYHENPAFVPDHNSVASRDNHVYELDHLATFNVNQRQGLMYPEDGMNRLRQMETSAGVWTMRCQMVIERKCVVILDKQTGDEMESFPLHLISEPTAFTNKDRKDLYNNVILFSVLEDTKQRHSGPSEMHIFQAIGISATDVVDEIKYAKTDTRPSHKPYGPPREEYTNYIPPPPVVPAPEPPGQRPHVRDAVSRLEQMHLDYGEYEDRPLNRFRDSYRRGPEDDRDSVTSEKTDREVLLLNRCFDDIERFVARLQTAAASFKELNDRKMKGKSKKDKRGHGEGMLTMRSRPPPPQDFIEIFQKFKLCFNLLARLKAHIHNPNSPELVHFLFTPLSLIVEASRDPRQGTPELAAKVVAPLLTHDAYELLTHCLSSKESDLWASLGDSWTVSKEAWKGYVPPFTPRFDDGWVPPPSIVEDGPTTSLANAVAHQAAQIRNREDTYRAREEAEQHVHPLDRSTRPPYRETVYREQRDYASERRSYDDIPAQVPHQDPRNQRAHEDRDRVDSRDQYREPYREPPTSSMQNGSGNVQKKFLRDLRASGAKAYEVLHDREGKNEKELTVAKGEIVELIDNSRNWWKLRNAYGKTGHAPYTILKEVESDHPLMSGDNFTDNDGVDGRNIYRERDNTRDRYGERESGGYADFIPPPPAAGPPPLVPQKSKPRKEEKPKSKTAEIHARAQSNPIDDVNSELKQRWSKIQTGRPKSTAFVYVTSNSSPAEVKEWLGSKGFSERTQKVFANYTGRDMFELSRHQVEKILGHDEGSRLESQLTVQKNICGYSATQGRTSELRAILEKRKERSNTSSTDDNESGRQLGRPPSYAPDSPPDSEVSSDQELEGDMTLRAQLRRKKKQICNN